MIITWIIMFSLLGSLGAIAGAAELLALADLVPDLHRRASARGSGGQVALLLLGIALIAGIRWATHR